MVLNTCTFQPLSQLGHRLSATTGDTKSYSYLLQRLSVAVQRGNAASIIGTLYFFLLPVLTFRGGGGGGGVIVCLLYMVFHSFSCINNCICKYLFLILFKKRCNDHSFEVN